MSLDLFDINSLLSEEEKAVQDSVSRFVKDMVDPVIQECFEKHTFPSELIKPLAELGVLGSSIAGYGCPGMNAIIYGLICKEMEKGDSGMRSFVSVQSSLVNVAIIWAHTDDGVRGFIVETDTDGFTANKIENKFSLRASVTSELFFDNMRIPDANVLPGVIGLKGPLSCLTQARYGISWGVIGAAESCLEQLLDYTQSRILFDRALDENQAIQIRLADMQRRIVTSSLLSYRLGQLKDMDQMNPTQVSLAKWNNVRMALDVARDCRDMLGGSGISAEYVPIRHMLNLESVVTYEGTETIHQLAVGRSLTGKNAF